MSPRAHTAELPTVAAIVAATVVADVRLRVTVAADVLLRALVHRAAEAEADRRTAEAVVVVDPRAAADRHTVVAVAADMEGKNTLDSFPA